jgi:hypothetical protein
VGTDVLAAVGTLIQQSSHWLSESQDKEAGDKAGLQETVRFVHDVASRITGTGKMPPTPRGDTIVRRPPQASQWPRLPSLRARIAVAFNILREVRT